MQVDAEPSSPSACGSPELGVRVAVVVCCRDEADRLSGTLAALRAALPDARLVVADDASRDATPTVARECGAMVVSAAHHLGKGGAATIACEHLLRTWPEVEAILLCDGDLADSASRLLPLLRVVCADRADLAVAVFDRRVGGGFGVALGFARWVVRRRCGLVLEAPISGQRALTAEALRAALPFAARFGMEIGMTVDVARSGLRVVEVALPLEHRATGRTWRGFAHRGRQLLDFVAVFLARDPRRARHHQAI